MSAQPIRQSLSIVIPVRNEQREVGRRVVGMLSLVVALKVEDAEIIVVDDGSRDGTYDQVVQLQPTVPSLRILRHDRPRGMEAAGQTGLERATGQLVMILEDQGDVRVEDVQKLLKIVNDESVVAARSQSTPRPPSPALLRRLRAWGSDADQQIDAQPNSSPYAGLQILRRSNLHALAGPRGPKYRLTSDTTQHYVVD